MPEFAYLFVVKIILIFTYSPLGFGGAGINSQVFYELRKNVL